jgi:A/G-specific adenine glycosylase
LVTANAAMLLSQHYVDNFRCLPWRSAPGMPAPDPYRVWLSEIMLQQTTVAAVTGRFERFVARWPTIETLAAARDEDVLGEWAGLGYYARARNLIACARAIVRLGAFPRTAAELIALPGLGDYTSAAIAAIAFGERASVVDTNIARVVARLHALHNPSAGQIRDLMLAMTPADRPGDFAQAMMDLGATICRPKAPACPACPLRAVCAGFARGTPEAFPEAKAKQARPLRHGIAWWTERDGNVWLVRRPPQGLLGGMAALPGSEWSAEPRRPSPDALGTVRHIFTHFALDLRIERRAEAPAGGWWHPLGRLDEAGLPSLYRRAAQLALADAPVLDEARTAP